MEIVLLKLSCVWLSTNCATCTRIGTSLTMESEIVPDSRGYFIIFRHHGAPHTVFICRCPIPQRFECIFELFMVVEVYTLDPENEVRSSGHCVQILCLHFRCKFCRFKINVHVW